MIDHIMMMVVLSFSSNHKHSYKGCNGKVAMEWWGSKISKGQMASIEVVLNSQMYYNQWQMSTASDLEIPSQLSA